MDPFGLFFILALLGLAALTGVAIWRYRRHDRGERGWKRVVFAALVWILATVVLGLPLGLLAFLLAHGPPDTNPWTAAPILLLSLPAYALVEFLLCRWAARDDSHARAGAPQSQPVA